MNKQTLEWAPFELRKGRSEKELLEASDRLQVEFLNKQEGFVRRELVRNGEGSYVDLVWWTTDALAAAAMANVVDSSACAAYFEMMALSQAEPGNGVLHFQSVKSY